MISAPTATACGCIASSARRIAGHRSWPAMMMDSEGVVGTLASSPGDHERLYLVDYILNRRLVHRGSGLRGRPNRCISHIFKLLDLPVRRAWTACSTACWGRLIRQWRGATQQVTV